MLIQTRLLWSDRYARQMYRTLQLKNKTIRNIENEEGEQDTKVFTENYNHKYISDYSSSNDNCVAAIAIDDYHESIPQNMKVQKYKN